MVSPFEFQHPLPPEQLRGRDDEVREIVDTAAGGKAITLAGPRRYGKTSVLLAARQRLIEAGHVVVLVDLYAVTSPAELAIRLERAWSAIQAPWRKVAGRALAALSVGVSLSGPGFAATLARQPTTDPLPALHALLDLPNRIRADMRTVVILDEFQSLAALTGAEGLLRSHVQHHADVAGYVFAGSEPHLLGAQFDSPDRPFYGQALRLRLGRPPRLALSDTIEGLFVFTDRHPGEALGPLLALADDHPQRAMMLAHFLWRRTAEGQAADLEAWETALDDARAHVADEVQAVHGAATTNQQRLLRLVAHDLSPYALANRVGMEHGSVARTLEQMLRDGLLERRPDRLYRLVDPMLRDWVRARLPL